MSTARAMIAAPISPAVEAPAQGTAARTRRLLAFVALGVFAAVEYSTLLTHPPTLRVIAAVGVAVCCGAVLGVFGRDRGAARAARVVLPVVALGASLAVLGVPLHLLLPWRWGTLVSELHRGLDGLEGWLWPYRGSARLARLAVLVPLAPALVIAACASFWPSARARIAREAIALALLVTLFMCGAVNQQAPAWRVQGLALALLIAAWLWLASPARERANRAVAWVLVASFGALLLAPVVSSGTPWLEYRAWDPVATEIGFRWNQTYGPITWSTSNATVFTVSERHPSLLQVISLDRFDGTAFVRSAEPPGVEQLDVPLAGPAASTVAEQTATITVSGLRSNLLVTGGGVPQGLHWLNGPAPSVGTAEDGTLTAGTAPSAGATYRVLSYDPDPGPAVLRAAPHAFPAAYLPYASFELPPVRAGARARTITPPAPGVAPARVPALARAIRDSPYAGAFSLARHLAAGEPNSYDIASRVSEYLKLHYVYNERPPRAAYPLAAFLSGHAGGYCQQFSGAMTLLLRMDGIPARVAEGFSPGLYDSTNNTWTVRAKDAHAWVEVYFPRTGWVAFDPTPPASTAAVTGSVLGVPLRGASTAAAGHAGRSLSASASRSRSARRAAAGGSFPLAAVLAAGGVGVVLLFFAGRVLLRGHRRLEEGLGGDADGAVAELRGALSRLGDEPPAGCTPAELERRLAARGADGAARYVALLTAIRYAPGPAIGPTTRDRGSCRRSLASGQGFRGRIGALLALPPGVARRA